MSEVRVLVTGGSGFIGRHLCARLVAEGRPVRATGRSAVRPPGLPAAIEWVRVDVGPDTDWSAALRDVGSVVHLAAHAHRTRAAERDDEATFQRVNAAGTRRLAEAVRVAVGVQRLVLLSSVAAVGEGADAIDERTECRPTSAYGRSKLAAEHTLQETLPGPGRPDWCVLRPPLVYGAGNPGNMERLLSLIRARLPLPLGAVRNRRSFVFVGNLVSAVIACLDEPAASRRVFMVADDEVVSTPELVRRLARTTGVSARLVPVPPPLLRAAAAIGDVVGRSLGRELPVGSYAIERLTGSLVVDASLIRRTLGWSAPHALDAALAETFAGARGAGAGAPR